MSKPRISRLIIQLKGNLGNPYGKLLQQPITFVVGYQYLNTWYGQRMNERERLLQLLPERDIVHLKKRCTARLCEVGTKGFFYLYRRKNTTMLDTSAADVNPLDESMDQY